MTETNLPTQWNAEKIKAARTERNWSQMELAEKLGCRLQTVCEWEKDHYVPQNAYQKLLTAVFK